MMTVLSNPSQFLTASSTNPVALLASNFDNYGTRLAIEAGSLSITYAELKSKVLRAAQWLTELGCTTGARVGIAVDEPVLFCEVVLAVAWIGGIYVPIEVTAAPQRLNAMLAAARVDIIICKDDATGHSCQEISRVATIPEVWPHTDTATLPAIQRDNSPLNIMFTSGSSGSPKGVICPVGGIVPLVRGACHVPFNMDDRVLQISARSFDAFTWELWGSLLNGACLVIPPVSWSIRSLCKFIASNRITVAFFTSRLFDAVVDAFPQSLAQMRVVAFGGEHASIKHCQRAVTLLPGVQFVNAYGPSENTTFTTSHVLDHTLATLTKAPIGKPAGNDITFLSDPQTGDLITGPGQGELLVGGPGLAISYTDPSLTASRFSHYSPPGHRLFRTGDLVERDAEGCYTWLGRLDKEVKVRGRRVDLNEVESTLYDFPGVSFVAVVHNALEQGELIAFYATATSQPIPTEQFTIFLSARMSAQAIPRHFSHEAVVPLNIHGKADRCALVEGFKGRLSRVHDTNAIAQLWARYLPLKQFERTTDFFGEGGDSLAALNMCMDVERLVGVSLEPSFIARHSTFGAFCEMLALETKSSYINIPSSQGDPLFVFIPPLLERGLSPYLHLAATMDPASYINLDYRKIFKESPPNTLESFSYACASEIRQSNPQRVVLIGHSIGGTAALDVAAELESQGVSVELVAMLDSFAAGARKIVQLKAALKNSLSPSIWFQRVRRLAKIESRHPESEDISEASTSVYSLGKYIGNWQEHFKLRPRIPKDARVVLFKAINSTQPQEFSSIEANGWRQSIPYLKVRHIDANHTSMLDHKNARMITKMVFEELEGGRLISQASFSAA